MPDACTCGRRVFNLPAEDVGMLLQAAVGCRLLDHPLYSPSNGYSTGQDSEL